MGSGAMRQEYPRSLHELAQGVVVVTWIVVFQRIDQFLLSVCIATSQGEDGPEPFLAHPRVAEKAILWIEKLIVGALGYLGGHLVIEQKDCDGFFEVRFVVEPIDRLGVDANEGNLLGSVLSGARAAGCGDSALIGSDHLCCLRKLIEMLLAGENVERR